MSRPGSSWWPDDEVEELAGNSPKRSKLETKRRSREEPTLSDLLAKMKESAQRNTEVETENPNLCEDSSLTGGDEASTESNENTKQNDDVWIVRRVIEESSDDEADPKSNEKEGDVNANDEEEPKPQQGCSRHAPHSQSLPGQLEGKFENMCLHEATEKRLFNVVFKKKEDVQHVNQWGETPLHFAAEIGATSIAMLLLDRGADPNATDDDGYTPLINACNFGHAEVAQVLLDAGANIDYQDDFILLTPLHFAAHGGHKDVVKLLLHYGADPSLEDRDGHMPCDFAFNGGHLELAEYLFDILDVADRIRHDRARPPINADAA